ncbi:hypothetical protein V6N11_065261 [Hibiscus sabdariffa]|uniref:Uncharacterized protein n=1 Tax=Hibiscus sabdariffa TaxID=183260 RepID=A0ABR2QGH2_9ROSI
MVLPLLGGKFTRGNNRDSPTYVRLDRFLIITNFENDFPSVVQKLLNKSLSNHNAILLSEEHTNWVQSLFESLIIGAKRRAMMKQFWSLNQKVGKSIQELEKSITVLKWKIQEGIASEDSFFCLNNLRVELWSAYRKEESKWLKKI